jgi:dihydropteroate synthase
VKVVALAAHTPEAVRAALAARGWAADAARLAAGGVRPLFVLLEGVSEPEREALVGWAARSGIDVLTGDGWALVAGGMSRLAPLARPDRAPPGLAPFVGEVARFIADTLEPPRRWAIGAGAGGAGAEISLIQPVIIGILNVTPDSFSDGGRLASVDDALVHAERLVSEGARMLDVGGESTRPGARPVPVEEELRRVVPVIQAIRERGLGSVSVDTRKSVVARAALEAGAQVVNDVTAFTFDTAMAETVARAGAGALLMHMRGTPETMDHLASYRHVAVEVAAELDIAAQRAQQGGVARERIVVDPGFGFAKTAEQNLRLLDELASVVSLGYPVAVGPSRKRFLGLATGRPVDDRDRATALACALAYERGARLFRVHDVALTREALALVAATSDSQ